MRIYYQIESVAMDISYPIIQSIEDLDKVADSKIEIVIVSEKIDPDTLQNQRVLFKANLSNITTEVLKE